MEIRENDKILLLMATIRNMPNRNQFQKPLMLARNFSVKALFKFPPETDVPFLSDLEEIKSFRSTAYIEHKDQTTNSSRTGILRIPGALLNAFHYSFWTILQMRRFKSGKGKIVYTTWDTASMVYGYIASLMGIQWVADIWDDPEKEIVKEPEGLKRTLRLRLNRKITSFLLSKADMVISVLPGVLLERYKLPAGKTIIHTNGVDLRELKRLEEQHQSNPDDEVVSIIYTGPVENNRLAYFPDIVKKLNRLKKPWKVTIVGPFFDRKDIDWLRDSCPDFETDRVSYLGEKPFHETVKMIIDSDICICPYPTDRADLANSYPIKVFEYMALGKPVVMFDLPKMVEILENRQDIIFIKNGDINDYTNAIIDLSENSDLRNSLGENARKKAESFNWEVITATVGARLAESLRSR